LDVAARRVVVPEITTISLEEAPEAHRKLAAGEVDGRPAVVLASEYAS